MKVKLLKTKTAGILALQGIAKITVTPTLWAANKISRKYVDTRNEIIVRNIKENLDTMSAQDKFDATVMYYDEMKWIVDPIIDHATTVIYLSGSHDYKNIDRFIEAYDTLVKFGVTQFTTKIDDHYYHLTHTVKNSI